MDDLESLDSVERSLARRGKMFAVVELLLGVGAFLLGWLLYHGGVSSGALSEHSVYFAGGAAVLGLIFVVGGVRRLLGSGS